MMIAVYYFSVMFIRPSLPSVHPIYAPHYSTHDIVVTSLITTSLLPFIVEAFVGSSQV